MSIWVRSQNKKALVECNSFAVSGNSIVGYQGAEDEEGIILASYKNEERALEVMNSLQYAARRNFQAYTMYQE